MSTSGKNPYAAYNTTQRNDESPRETEAQALLSCAGRLERVRNNDVSREEFADAIQHNQKLWTVFQVGLCEPDNPLPSELKVTLLNLSLYVDKTSFQAVATNDPELLRSLISINRNVAAGLSAAPKEAPHEGGE